MDHWRRLSRRRNIAAMQGLGLPIAGRRWMRAWLGLGPTDCRSLLLKQGGRTDPRLRLYRRLRQLEREFDRLIKPSSGQLLDRSEEHTSELQSRGHLVCRLLLEK